MGQFVDLNKYLSLNKMKAILFFLLLFPIISFGQIINSTERKSMSNIYNDAIKQYLINLVGNRKTTKDTLYVMETETYKDSILSNIYNTPVKIIDVEQMEGILANRDFTLHKFSSVNYQNRVFAVTVIPFSTRKIDNEVTLGNSGGCEMRYTFDDKAKQFRFIKTKCWGL